MMTRAVPLSLACWDYDRTRGVREGRFAPAGIDLTYLSLPPEETFFRMLKWREFDVSEMSLSSYVLTLAEDPSPFVAIPVFPSRAFRHGAVFVRSDSPFRGPADLRGGTVGIPEYQMSAAVWIRGIFEEHYGLPVSSVSYRTGGLHEPGRTEKLRLELPPSIDVQPIPPDRTLNDMLVAGELDAVYTARAPRDYGPDGRVRRLFQDVRAEEEVYARRTGIFPIMHVLVLKREVYEQNRWMARSLMHAFSAAKAEATAQLDEVTALKVSLPWAATETEATRDALGQDFWPYGVTSNWTVLDTFLRYSHSQHLAQRRFSPEELFAAETLDEVRV